jgi:hypothetical protein
MHPCPYPAARAALVVLLRLRPLLAPPAPEAFFRPAPEPGNELPADHLYRKGSERRKGTTTAGSQGLFQQANNRPPGDRD